MKLNLQLVILINMIVIQNYSSIYKFNYAILRYFNVAGCDDQNRTGFVKRGPLFNNIAENLAKNKSEISIYGNKFPTNDGTAIRDYIFIEELIKADLYKTVSQAFAVYLPIKSVGVVGDERRYAEVIGLRAVETVDFMTAKWAHLPYEFLEHVSNRIVNEIEEVSRVVYDISSKPPATIEWE